MITKNSKFTYQLTWYHKLIYGFDHFISDLNIPHNNNNGIKQIYPVVMICAFYFLYTGLFTHMLSIKNFFFLHKIQWRLMKIKLIMKYGTHTK